MKYIIKDPVMLMPMSLLPKKKFKQKKKSFVMLPNESFSIRREEKQPTICQHTRTDS